MDGRNKIWDANLQLASSNTIATASYTTYGASTIKTIDLGAQALTKGDLIIDVSDIEDTLTQASGTVYEFILRGSNASSFDSSYVALARFRLGVNFASESIKDAGCKGFTTVDSGRFIVPWRNQIEAGGTCYEKLRLRVLFGGSFTSGITFSAFLSKD